MALWVYNLPNLKNIKVMKVIHLCQLYFIISKIKRNTNILLNIAHRENSIPIFTLLKSILPTISCPGKRLVGKNLYSWSEKSSSHHREDIHPYS